MHYQRVAFPFFFSGGFRMYRHRVPYILYAKSPNLCKQPKKKKNERQNRFLLISIYDQQSCYFHLNNSLFYIIPLCAAAADLFAYYPVQSSSSFLFFSYNFICNHLMTLTWFFLCEFKQKTTIHPDPIATLNWIYCIYFFLCNINHRKNVSFCFDTHRHTGRRLDSNDISQLDPLVFTGLTSLRQLRLDVNRLSSVPHEALSHVTTLEVL